jgi:hypothetical protein
VGHEAPWQEVVYGESSNERLVGINVAKSLWFACLLEAVPDELPKLPGQSEVALGWGTEFVYDSWNIRVSSLEILGEVVLGERLDNAQIVEQEMAP